MSGTALGLALAAAVVHAVWNLLLARARDVESATAIALLLAVVIWAPFAALSWNVDADVWPYALGSALFELVYVALLAAAYGRAEMTVVYPVARGLAPVLVLVVGVLALSRDTSAAQIAGVVLICIGIVLVRGVGRGPQTAGVLFGLAIAAAIAGYTLFDSVGIHYASPIAYLEVVMAGPAVVYFALVARVRGRQRLRAELNLNTFAAAVAAFGGYILALVALRHAPAPAVAAVRETSVVVAVALGALFLGERVTPARVAGAAVVAAGLIVIGR